MYKFIDTHAHLYMKQYSKNLSSVISEAASEGVEYIIVPSSNKKSLEANLKLIDENQNIYGALGIHPHYAKDFSDEVKQFIELNLGHKKILAIGETGLDFHYTLSPKDAQIECFIQHVKMAERFSLPLIIHMRKSFDEIKNILDHMEKIPRGVIHCFSGGPKEAEYFLSKGFYLSFTGLVTFNKDPHIMDALEIIPLDKFFLETDSPYLTPEPYRGTTNHPKYVKLIAEKIAKVKKIELEDVARITTKTAKQFFSLPFGNQPQYAFTRGQSLFLNITNEKNNKMPFNHQFRYPYLQGYYLVLNREPSIEEIKKAIQNNIIKIKNIVFINYGESTLREKVLKEAAAYAKSLKLTTVLDTDGLANKYYQRNFVSELKGIIDEINITLNASNSKEYQQIHHPPFGQESFNEVIQFAREATRWVAKVKIHSVNLPNFDINSCMRIFINDNQIGFEQREYIE